VYRSRLNLTTHLLSVVANRKSDNSIILLKENCNYDIGNITSVTLLEPRKIVRIIGKEEGGIPLLGCINEKGFVKEVD
jgi:hypothetical protein